MKRLYVLGCLVALCAGCNIAPSTLPASAIQEPTVSPGTPAQPRSTPLPANTVAGMVVDEHHEPVPGAVVRLQTKETYTITKADGYFYLENIPLDSPVAITAWAEGFFINHAQATPEKAWIIIEIHRFAEEDNPAYEWLPSGNLQGEGEDQGCAECHLAGDSNSPFSLPVDEWLQDAHSQSAVNPRFLSAYNGSDLHGNQSPLTTFIPASPYQRNSSGYEYVALAPDLDQPYFGPGYRIDFPDSAGNCGSCHTPGAAAKPSMGFNVDVNRVEGVDQEGVFCDFCHKVWDAKVDPLTRLPMADRPGVMSFTFRRPPEGHQFFAGPYDDVSPGEDTYSAIQRESVFCAPCHFGFFWEVPIYNSYGEWLESPYSDPLTGQTCQDCHMPPLGATRFAQPEAGALERDPETIFSHRMPGAMDENLLQNAVSMQVSTALQEQELRVQVKITNDQTGHYVPTDYPGRHLILLVTARDRNGTSLLQTDGPVLPDWCGVGDPQSGYFAGQPGKTFAKVLKEDWTGYYPTLAYWNPTTVVADTRLKAFETDVSEYTFQNPDHGEIRIEVRLFLRRSYIEFMDWKDWDTPDILMEETILDL